jgi:hypothetical protein
MMKAVFVHMVERRHPYEGSHTGPVEQVQRQYVVTLCKNYDWTDESMQWTHNPLFDGNCLRLAIDIVEEQWTFDDEDVALNKVAELYAMQFFMNK